MTGTMRSLPKQPESAEEIVAFLKDAASDQMAFTVKRPPAPGVTFSKAALQQMLAAINTFVGARLQAHWEQAPHVGPSELTVAVQVTIDGVTLTVSPENVPYFEIDGAQQG